MQIKDLFVGIPLLMFAFWVFMAPTPMNRIERVCEPINWVGNLATSTTALTKEAHTATAATWSDNLNYSCRYLIWRLFYQKDYNEAIRAGLLKPGVEATAVGEESPAQGVEPLEAVEHEAEAPPVKD